MSSGRAPAAFDHIRRLFSAVCGCGRNFSFVERLDAELLAKLTIDAAEDVLVLLEEGTDVLAALTDALALEAVPGAGLVDDIVQHGEIERVAFLGDAFAVKDVELGVTEGSGDLVLDDLDLGAIANDNVTFLDGSDATNVDAN